MVRWSQLADIDNVLGLVGLTRVEKSSGIGSFFVGLGVGMIAGGATALLLTPYKGTEAREKLIKAGEDLGRLATERYEQLTSGQHAGNGASHGTQSASSSLSSGPRVTSY